MLERIVTIESGFDFRKPQGRSKQFDKAFAHAVDNRIIGSDSANLSPAAVFLQRMHWRLIKLKQSSSEKVLLHFLVDDIEFETDLELTPHSSGKQRFLMSDYFLKDGKRLRCGTLYSLERKLLTESAEYELAPLNAVKAYFERAVSDSKHHDFPVNAIPEISWYDTLNDRLSSELNNIYTGALALVEKVVQGAIHRVTSERQQHSLLELERFTIVEM